MNEKEQWKKEAILEELAIRINMERKRVETCQNFGWEIKKGIATVEHNFLLSIYKLLK